MTALALPLPAKRLLTAKEAAAYCGVSVNTMKAYVKVMPVKIGNCVRYDVQELDRWLDGQRQSEPLTGDDWLGMLDEGEGARD